MANTSAALYRDPVADLSQCDVVEISPHAYIDPPLRWVREMPAGEIQVTEIEIRSLLSGTDVIARCSPEKALIINYDCEIAKSNVLRLVICPVVPLSRFEHSQQGNIKRNRTAHLFFLPRFRTALDDSVAVLNQLTTVHRVMFSDLNRLVTLTRAGRLAFYGQFVRWLTRWELRTVPCPNCNVEFDPTLALRVRSAEDE